MNAKELLDAGQLGEAVQAVTQEVRQRPADTSLRVMLFELLCFEGAFDRAAKQLDVIAGQGTNLASELAVQVYKDLLAAEQTRHSVFHGAALPKFVLTPPAYADRYVVLVKKLQQAPAEAAALLAEAEESFPASAGSREGGTFSAFRDADDRLGPMLEVFHGRDYLWVPIEQIARLQVSEPKSLRDLIWARARLEMVEQPVGDVFIPALYVDSAANADPHVRLGRLTTWQAVEDQLVYGAGRRMFLVDGEEQSLLEMRDVAFGRRDAAEVGA
jgi:type VI secretion system protein ImpE